MIVSGKTYCSKCAGPDHFTGLRLYPNSFASNQTPKAFLPSFPVGPQTMNGFHVVLFWLMKGCSVHLSDQWHRNYGYMGMVSFCRALIGANLDYFLLSKQCFAFLLGSCLIIIRNLITQGWNDQNFKKLIFDAENRF